MSVSIALIVSSDWSSRKASLQESVRSFRGINKNQVSQLSIYISSENGLYFNLKSLFKALNTLARLIGGYL
jgi:hypothetical protein